MARLLRKRRNYVECSFWIMLNVILQNFTYNTYKYKSDSHCSYSPNVLKSREKNQYIVRILIGFGLALCFLILLGLTHCYKGKAPTAAQAAARFPHTDALLKTGTVDES
ncbi:hypothetical protein DPMN_189331 [Dreissena polymorpha]|uniref:Uncharacterized protein n=1 Tax=Dreissena polymorpha TaxID=45954 RepID=A0A9D4DU52_DREPO|nr:hypothetical protein DPMN_189331 [Dreissena polymorpha]